MAPENKCKCGRKLQVGKRKCNQCQQNDRIRENNKSPHYKQAPPRTWKKMSKEDILHEVGCFIKRWQDVGESSTVKIYRPGDPGFADLARQYGGI